MSAASLPEDVRRALGAAASGRGGPRRAPAPLDPHAPLFVARAPGRLDLMGGIADYSGSEVLQMPIREAAIVAVQRTAVPELEIASLDTRGTRAPFRCALDAIVPNRPTVGAAGTTHGGGTGRDGGCGGVERDLERHGERHGERDADGTLEAARRLFARDPASAWAGYVGGVFPVLAARGAAFSGGARLVVVSDVPEGKGVSSSAAIEVATMRAVAAAWGVALDPYETARLCQRVENRVVGAPCGLMDQMTSSAGVAGRLLSLLCQPDRLLPPVAIPPGLAVFGIDSGIRHAVGGADYGAVRTAAFIGYRLLLERAGVADAGVPAREIVDTRWGGYLANVMPSELDGGLAEALPDRVRGAEFLARFDASGDTLTRVRPDADYPVRRATEHPVREHFRVRLFRSLLQAWAPAHAPLLGECMYRSHASYSACGLGSDGTDRLVALARAAGSAAGIHGARITGGGSGGTVAILADADADATVRRIAATYRRESGRGGHVFDGSSDGARVWRLARADSPDGAEAL